MTDSDFVLQGNKLVVHTNLDPGKESELRAYCDRLLGGQDVAMIIDLSAVSYIHSLSVGALSYAWVEALSHDREISFVVSQNVADVFARTGLSKVFSCTPPIN